MAGAQRSSARWIALLLGVALVASAAVAYALIRVTAPGSSSGQDVSASQSTATASMPVSPADVTVSSSSTGTPATTGTGSGPPTASATAPGPAGASPAPASPTPSVPPPDSSGPASSPADRSTSESDAVTTQTSTLQGSGVTLPAAWSGTATITVRVLGDCATRTPSVYTAAPADLALDLTQNEVAAAAPTATTAVPANQPTLTLGVNTSAVPAITVYSSAVAESGAFHRYWQITLIPEADRTGVQATLADQAAQGANLNTLTDTETSLQPCEDPGTVGLPRALATGSTLSGWVSSTSANLTLHATTTDHKRAVTVQISAVRKQ